ncbi:hypothetical protein INR77_11195 [Erythrobacter sp. SCSIO 43205]|uniref:glycine-rich domain-containing protein n=1 Tax=Erythrobacter sp. SCSIO 43205 TaxID=2779361 RepID=UPI001CA92989|nr:hypothetical protein [Erythrobacter sp. SCSIO 43205]UAB77371.1 hypothetical protein INR77_11195 [Erythrobacter sp. SCSIO 43205]
MSALADTDLWRRLEGYTIGPVDAEFTFAARLARENRWTVEHAEAVIHEYKRFCYLACTAEHEVTPSDAVDQVWHLHLTFSREYWGEFCPTVLGMDLHHGPTAGGTVERTRYYDQYAQTFRSYERTFGEPPPADIWPSAGRRFGVDPKSLRINPHDVMILDRRLAILGAVGWVTLGIAIAVVIGVIF